MTNSQTNNSTIDLSIYKLETIIQFFKEKYVLINKVSKKKRNISIYMFNPQKKYLIQTL